MNRKIAVGIGLFILIISPFLAVAETTISELKDLETTMLNNKVDVPIWTNGDTWKYDFELEGELEDIMSFNWAFKDIIFVPKKNDYNLSDDFVRVRVMIKKNWPTKDVILVRKKPNFWIRAR